MDVGLALPQFDFSVPGERPLRWETVGDWARRAEALGFGSVWVADHLFWDVAKYGGPEEAFDVYDPFAGLGAGGRLPTPVRPRILVARVPPPPPAGLGGWQGGPPARPVCPQSRRLEHRVGLDPRRLSPTARGARPGV